VEGAAGGGVPIRFTSLPASCLPYLNVWLKDAKQCILLIIGAQGFFLHFLTKGYENYGLCLVVLVAVLWAN
jgi:isochorismate hydrolase